MVVPGPDLIGLVVIVIRNGWEYFTGSGIAAAKPPEITGDGQREALVTKRKYPIRAL